MATFTIFYAKSLRYVPREAPESINPLDYNEVGPIEASCVGETFQLMNAVEGDELCCKMSVRSMSVGDVVVDESGQAHYCCAAGWGETEFVPVENPLRYLTSDGYSLTWTGLVWTNDDMTFEGDEQGPIDNFCNRVEGDLL